MIDESPEAVRERFRAEGIATSFSELLGERPPDEENGWILLSEWIRRSEGLIAENAESADRILDEMSETSEGDRREESAAGFLAEAKVQESIGILQAILDSPEWYPVREWEDGFELTIPEIGSIRKLGLTLSVALRYSLMHPEQSQWTPRELLFLQMHLARKSASEPYLISYLTGIALARMPQEDVRWFYNESSTIPLSPPFDQGIWIDFQSTALIGERLFGEIAFRQIRNGDESILSWIGVLEKPSGFLELATQWAAKFLLYLSAQSDEDQYLKLMELPLEERDSDLWSKVVQQYKIDDPISIPSILVPALGNVESSLAKMSTAFNAWQVALEIERYKSENTRYPRSLNLLNLAKAASEELRYLPSEDRYTYILLPLDPDLAEDALEEDLSPLVWFPPNLRIEDVRRRVEADSSEGR